VGQKHTTAELLKSEPATAQRSRASKKRLWVGLAVSLFVAVVIIVAIASAYAGRVARKHLVEAIEKHYHAKVELKHFTVIIFPRIVIHGEGLVLRQTERTDVPPFISVERFTTDAGILDLLRKQKRIRSVTLEGLNINIARREKDDQHKQSDSNKNIPDFVIDQVKADGTKLRVFPKDPKKDPLEFDIQKLSLESAGNNRSMNYRAELTNAKPPGLIHSQGRFGPFNTDETGQTPLAGKYQFRNADLSVFHGISGMLSSDGEFSGVLENISVDGTTTIPDFEVRDSGHPVDLKTEFHAVVDGTNGDTILDPVNAMFLNSHIEARGKVDGVPGIKGKAVSLTVDAENTRVEDLLMLVIKGKEPLLTGNATFHASFVLPPGKGDVVDRLKLEGDFGLGSAKFTKPRLQQKVAQLSSKAQGHHEKPATIATSDTASNCRGHFALNNGVAKFTRLEFDVPSAKVALAGNYNLDTEQLDFRGHLYMDAKISEMTTGIKSFFARILQPLVTKNDNTVIPIKISGSRTDPKFGVQVGKLITRD
jgi:uncharacterized protein involved in outer membrane biogenesis